MTSKVIDKDTLSVSLKDFDLIYNAILNKGMAFTEEEREAFNLLGLLPPYVSDLEIQRERSYLSFKRQETDFDKYLYLRDLQDSNETLFYSLLVHHVEEFLPIVYTPTVGMGCQRFSHVYRRPRGIFIAYPDKDKIDKIFANERFDRVKAIVVSDGERILGLGDQGAGGMGIPIGKLALYTACGGIHPTQTLPILLDVGTNNETLLSDPLYIGWRNHRIRGDAYYDFIDAFVTSVKKRFPHILLQWEDFAQINANPLLQKYRDQLCTFNDDIQGTAAVAAGTLFAAFKATRTDIKTQRIVVVGAGSAGCGISSLVMRAMVQAGLNEKDAADRFYLVDQHGLLTDNMMGLQDFQKPFVHSIDEIKQWHLQSEGEVSFIDVIKNVHPTVLIGVSGQPNIFTEEIVREMAKHVERPIIFPLSNPTNRAEAIPHDLLNWTEGRAIISTGSPFPSVTRGGKSYRIDQTNNCYIFPGLGLGLIAVKSKRVTDQMFMQAALALSELAPANKDPDANLLPPLSEIRDISLHIAIATAKEAIKSGLSEWNQSIDIESYLKDYMWIPKYMHYVPAK